MKAKVIGLVLTVAAFNGCASTGPASNDGPRVPVFRVGQDTPCDYESMGRIVAEGPEPRLPTFVHLPPPSLPRRVEFEGEAVRWIEGTCKGSATGSLAR